jgi:hypothetical protein
LSLAAPLWIRRSRDAIPVSCCRRPPTTLYCHPLTNLVAPLLSPVLHIFPSRFPLTASQKRAPSPTEDRPNFKRRRTRSNIPGNISLRTDTVALLYDIMNEQKMVHVCVLCPHTLLLLLTGLIAGSRDSGQREVYARNITQESYLECGARVSRLRHRELAQ